MNRFAVFLWCITFSFYHGNAQNSPPAIFVTGDQFYCENVPMQVVTSVSINDADDSQLDDVFIQISEGYASGFDVLTLTGNHPNISSTWNPAAGQLILNGPASLVEFENAILAVVFTTSQTTFTSDRSFSINLADAIFLPSTGHYYIYESSPGITWQSARIAASQQTFFGLQGYLATITSEEEAQLSGEQSAGTGWIGASDAANEGTWLWVTGPEAGTQFWQGAASGTPVNEEYSFWNIGEPNDFGDEDYAHITDPSVGEPGSWNDLNVTGSLDPTSEYHPQGYLVEFGGLPGEPQINLSAASSITMPQVIYENEFACAGQELTLSLTTNTNQILWYESETSDVIINTGNTYVTTVNQTTTFWVDARLDGCTIEDRRPLVVSVNPLPEFNNISIQQCDDESADGVSTFRLFNYEMEIVNGTTTNREVAFYEDLDLTIPINGLSYNNQFSGQIVYAQVINSVTSCFQIAEITLHVSSNVSSAFTLQRCDDNEEDGMTQFSLSSLNGEVLEGFPVTIQVDYFPSIEEALRNQNELPSLYTNTTPYSQTIYVKLSEGDTCLAIYPVTLIVEQLPQLLENETLFYCLNRPSEELVLSSGLLDNNINNYSFEWSTGETTEAINISDIGTYTVEVTEIDGCSKERTINVEPSNIATIENVEINDLALNNSVEIFVTGEGEYQYSVISHLGPYQESPIFQDIPSGFYTVYVRDKKNDCGISEKNISVLGYPKVFTPNGDGYNDYWKLNGVSQVSESYSEVYIYDRFGRLLVVLNSLSDAWDGTYNGIDLPADDYWFVLKLNDGRIHKNHFTLKR